MLAFIVGLQAEARLAGGRVFVGGGKAEGAEAAAGRAVAAGASALVSFGLAGGLSPALAAGTVLAPRAVVSGGETYASDSALALALGGTPCGAVLAASGIAVSARDKASLWGATGAEIVDLESGAVARAAAQAGLPFAVLRVVCDHAGRTLPPAALLALDASGGIGLLRVAGSVLRHPRQLPDLLALARDAAAARRALARHMASLRRSGALQAWR